MADEAVGAKHVTFWKKIDMLRARREALTTRKGMLAEEWAAVSNTSHRPA